MGLFDKITQGASNLFNKVTNDPNLFRKIDNTARKIDNSVVRVGAFLKPIANIAGLGGVVDSAVAGVHGLRNNLERSVKQPIGKIRDGNSGIVNPFA